MSGADLPGGGAPDPAELAAGLPPPRLGDRAWFPGLQARVYLNHAGVSPPSLLVERAVLDALRATAALGLGAVPRHIDQRERLRARLASLVGARPQDLALVANTSTGVLDIAFDLPWRAGDRVLCFQGEFPTNVTPWQRAAETFGLGLDFQDLEGFGDGSGDGLSRLEARLRQGLRLVAVSAVQFQPGLRMPLREMAALCHAHGAELFVDAIQAVGALPLDLAALGVDYLSCGSHKWCMGTEGAAFVYIHPDRVGSMVPRLCAWLSHEDPVRFLFEGQGHLRYDRPFRRRADFLEIGAPNSLGFVALEAGIRPLLALGPAAIAAHVQALHDRLEEGLLARGFDSARAVAPEARSGILSLRPPPGVPLSLLHAGLGRRGISLGQPDGWLRLAPHWPNGAGEVSLVLDAVDEVLGELSA